MFHCGMGCLVVILLVDYISSAKLVDILKKSNDGGLKIGQPPQN
jgi:hypothetical protein